MINQKSDFIIINRNNFYFKLLKHMTELERNRIFPETSDIQFSPSTRFVGVPTSATCRKNFLTL